MKPEPLPIVVLISGQGSNLQAIIDAVARGLPIKIRAVISNHPDAYGMKRAEKAHIPTHLIAHQNYSTRPAFENALKETIDRYDPKVIVLAGFMRKLGPEFVSHYRGRLLNIHPSLLPKYKGLHTHRRVLEARESEHGVSVHYATEDVDGGPIICQAKLAIGPNDTEESLKQRIHKLEHIIYPKVLSWIAAGRLSLKDHTVFLDGKPLPPTGKPLNI